MRTLLCHAVLAAFLGLFPVHSALGAPSACTTMIVTAGASADGSVMVSHSDDNDLSDQSIVFVPARDWPAGARRPVYPSAVAVGPLPEFNAFFIPRLVSAERAPGYAHSNAPPTLPVGYIPQVAHTYAYLDGNYGIVNEHGLMFGECTDGSLVKNTPEPGRRLFYAAELSRVALERCTTAREAIALMGKLIETYGYYGTGETLPLADAKEAWVMEMAPSPTGEGGLWVAQRVPDGHYFVAANEFRIRDVRPGDPDQMHGASLFAVIEKAGWRSPADSSKPMDWLTSVSHGEYNHPYYSLRRVWRALSLAAPSLGLSPWVKDGATRDYPFSVKPDKPMTLEDVAAIHRDHYEGTEFDMTKGLAAGPFDNPKRYIGPNDPKGDVTVQKDLPGAWERPICMFYAGFTYINQLRPDVPYPLHVVSWMALDTPGESVFLPLAVGPLPPGYEQGDPRTFDADSAWWTYNLVAEYANLKYSYMIKDIRERARLHEQRSVELLDALRKRLAPLAAANPGQTAAEFAAVLGASAEEARQDWQKLFMELAAKYNQGFVNSPEAMAGTVGYPEEWLRHTGYAKGPIRYEKPAE